LVHGLYADASCWIDVIPYLQKSGLNVTAVQNPLTSLADAAAATRRIHALQKGPTVLVGHSFAGTEEGARYLASKISQGSGLLDK
jgi:hypothetical protein